MYFSQWLLARIRKTLFGDASWDWVRAYRDMIIDEKPLALLITLGLGLIWFMVASLVTVLGFYEGDSREVPSVAIWIHAVIPIVIFFYNWIMALYEIFDAERMATWNTLKEE